MSDMPTVMSKDTAWKLIVEAVRSFHGTLEQHQTLQTALGVLARELAPQIPEDLEEVTGG